MQVVMDIGGTNCRIATLDENHSLKTVESWSCPEFSGPAEALSSYIEMHKLEVKSVCIAVASPLVDNQVTMTNLDWSFSGQSLKEQLSLKTVTIINDYHAIGLAIPLLAKTEKVQIGEGSIEPDKLALICGPGTGLGVAMLARTASGWQVLPGEGGHMDFAPNTPYEQEIWRIFHRKYGHVSTERILSGPGLIELHAAICEIDGIDLSPMNAQQISDSAIAGNSTSCQKTLDLFCAMLGSYCGSLALATASFGGVYIAGGIVPRFVDYVKDSEFRNRFEDKGRYRSYNQKIATYIVTAPYPGLLGAAAYLRRTDH